MRKQRKKICGIYYLWDGAEVIYIGKSTDVRHRISAHRSDRFDFAGYFVDECSPEELFEREAEAIAEFMPRYNVSMMPDEPRQPERELEKAA